MKITSVKTNAGPAIEFLEYLTPRDGRPLPLDEKANDLMHWQTQLIGGHLDAAAEKLFKRKFTFISPGVVQLPHDELGFGKSFLVRDPDGHVMQLIEK